MEGASVKLIGRVQSFIKFYREHWWSLSGVSPFNASINKTESDNSFLSLRAGKKSGDRRASCRGADDNERVCYRWYDAEPMLLQVTDMSHEVEVWCGFTTASMAIAFASSRERKPKVRL